ncbi:unnamed protein product [Larinioides sclopetarius]|uniref:Uncharacterized protein n=1 Tax=Larinioides sclopetarius TaxID=280406 RepID=A0AAV1ZRC2_9ARAC
MKTRAWRQNGLRRCPYTELRQAPEGDRTITPVGECLLSLSGKIFA